MDDADGTDLEALRTINDAVLPCARVIGRHIAQDDVATAIATANANGRNPATRHVTFPRDASLGWRDAFSTAPSEPGTVLPTADLAIDHQLGMWDSMISAEAAQAGCRFLRSEDRHDGLNWGEVTIVVPFSATGSPMLEFWPSVRPYPGLRCAPVVRPNTRTACATRTLRTGARQAAPRIGPRH